jgi:cobalt-zinc-cadmium efflux system protein
MQGSSGDQMKEPGDGRKLLLATAITLSFAGVEAAAGWWSGSLALISDAGHMVTDSAALLIAALAGWVARRGPSPKHSYGFGRAQLVAALVNGLFMLAVVTAIIVQAVSRFTNPIAVQGEAVTVVASLGLLLNIFVARMLSHGGRDLTCVPPSYTSWAICWARSLRCFRVSSSGRPVGSPSTRRFPC